MMLFLMACSSQKDYIEKGNEPEAFEPNIAVDLTTRLKGYAGLRVYGDGSRATITMRGVSSISGGNEPLFILNGNQMPNYAELHGIVSSQSIKRIEVLKNPNEIGIYGTRGSNGVIKVTTVDNSGK
jgi:Outer membrane cobalamin receptor protein